MIVYLFSDIYRTFRRFFASSIHESKFLYDIAFGFMPRKFDCNNKDDCIIYDEEEDVTEMYFILHGIIGIGFSLNSSGITKKNFYISKKEQGPYVICDHYVVNNKKSEFIYMAIDIDIDCLALSKKFLNTKVFPKYPEIAFKIRQDSLRNYYSKIF